MSTTSTKKPEQVALLEVASSEKPQREEEAKSPARFTSPRPLRPWQPEQGQLLPQYAREVLGEEHLACFFVDLAETLDFSPILGAYAKQCGLAQQVGQNSSDARQLSPMVEQVEANTGLVPEELSADSGYLCQEDLEKVEAKGVEFFIATGRDKHGQEAPPAPRGRPPEGLSFKERTYAIHNLKMLWNQGWELPSLAAQAA